MIINPKNLLLNIYVFMVFIVRIIVCVTEKIELFILTNKLIIEDTTTIKVANQVDHITH